MALVEKSVLIGIPQQMFDLVDRVEDYPPQFLPWCNRTELKFRDAHKTCCNTSHQLPQRQVAFHDGKPEGCRS